MQTYDRSVRKDHEQVLTASSDIGQSVLCTDFHALSPGHSSHNTGNVSYVTPTLHTMFVIPAPEGASPHHPSFTAAAGTDEAHKEAIVVGKSLALIGWEMLTETALLERARQQWRKSVHDSHVDSQKASVL